MYVNLLTYICDRYIKLYYISDDDDSEIKLLYKICFIILYIKRYSFNE